MLRSLGARLLFLCVALAACEVDSRNVTSAGPSLMPTSDATADDPRSSMADAGDAPSNALAVDAGSPARLVVGRTELDFGEVVQTIGAVLDLSISNGGDEPMPPLTTRITGQEASEFQVSASACATPLAAKMTCSMAVSFTPGAMGTRAALLELAAGSAGSVRLELRGMGVRAGDLELAPAANSSTDFGAVVLGAEERRVFHLDNPTAAASGPLEIAVNSDEFVLLPATGADCASGVTDLPGGAGCDVRVGFRPAQRGPRNATLSVLSSMGGVALNLSGVGLSPAALAASGSVDFGRVAPGTSATRELRVTNEGDAPLGAVAASLTGPNAGQFSVERNDCTPGVSECSIGIAFAPSSAGSRLATLTLVANPGGSLEVTLGGVGLGSLVLTPAAGAAADFGDVVTFGAGASRTQTFLLSNAGQMPSGTISIDALSTGFRILAASGSDCVSDATNLAPNSSCSIRVEFSPAFTGLHQATLSVDSTVAGSASLALRANGVVPVIMRTEPNFINFAPTTVGQTANAPLTVHNDGDLAATSLIVSIVGAPPDFFFRLGSCTDVLAGRSSCVLDVSFAPRASGESIADLQITSPTFGVLELPLSGRGL